jgi:hypothetical protein
MTFVKETWFIICLVYLILATFVIGTIGGDQLFKTLDQGNSTSLGIPSTGYHFNLINGLNYIPQIINVIFFYLPTGLLIVLGITLFL